MQQEISRLSRDDIDTTTVIDLNHIKKEDRPELNTFIERLDRLVVNSHRYLFGPQYAAIKNKNLKKRKKKKRGLVLKRWLKEL